MTRYYHILSKIGHTVMAPYQLQVHYNQIMQQ